VNLTLAGLKELWPERRLVAVFEPRSNTSRRNFFQDEYAKSFSAADVVLIKAVAGDSGYSKSGEEIVSLDTDRLAQDIESQGVPAQSIFEIEALLENILKEKRKDDLIVLMSNGDFGGLKGKLIEALSE